MSIPESLILIVPIIYIALVVYVLILVTRLVKAVERIANKIDSAGQ